jgi:hypothetical protein
MALMNRSTMTFRTAVLKVRSTNGYKKNTAFAAVVMHAACMERPNRTLALIFS